MAFALPAPRTIAPGPALGIGAALLVGGALAGLSPALAVLLGMVALVAAITALWPVAGLVLSLLSIAITPEYLEPLRAAESAIARGHRLLVLAGLLPLLLLRGSRRAGIPLPVIAYGVLLVLTIGVVNTIEGLTPSKAVFALLTLSLGWIASRVVLDSADQRSVLVAIAVVPLVSVVAGFLLQFAGLTTLFGVEYTGVSRLQGASIPAFLAMMAVAGAAGSVLLAELGRRNVGLTLALTNLVILGLTGTRGALGVTLVLMLPLLWRIMLPPNAPTAVVALRILVAATIVGIAIAVYAPVLVARSQTTATSGFDTSGRTEAWSFYLEKVGEESDFGLGLGSAPVLGEQTVGVIRGDFRGAHNEYVRLFVEGGWVGVTLVVGAIGVYLAGFIRGTARRLRSHLIALVLAFALYSVVDNTVSTFQFFLPFGLLLGVYGSCHALAAQTRPAGRA